LKKRATPENQLLGRYFQAIANAQPDVTEAELRATWLRRASRFVFARHGLHLPASARLFGSDARASRLEQLAEEQGPQERLALEAWFALPNFVELTPPHLLGAAFEALEALELAVNAGLVDVQATRRRRRTGTFFTPPAVAAQVAELALNELERIGRLDAPDLRVCDPSCGGSAFLLETADKILSRKREQALHAAAPFDEDSVRRWLVECVLVGVDIDPTALAISELSLLAFAQIREGERLQTQLFSGDAVTGPAPAQTRALERTGLDWRKLSPASGFDLIVGNPPWVAYAGRAAQPLKAAKRAFFRACYAAFHGYPTLQAVFVERALSLAPNGVVALLVPSPLADLDGYRGLRDVVFRKHEPCEPLLEFGQDAFREVVQPCFALVVAPRATKDAPSSGRRFRLSERARAGEDATTLSTPAILHQLAQAEKLPAEMFGELGFQSTRVISERLFARTPSPCAPFDYPLLEGKDVREFRVGSPRLFLHADPALLKAAGCRLRGLEEYRRARFVVRQTARAPIAALSPGLPFRNSLLAGFEVPGYSAELLVGLLNSSLFRAFHLATQRDGRQMTFPQVKVSHLRALPRPRRRDARIEQELCEGVQRARDNLTPALKQALDEIVFELYDVPEPERVAVIQFLRERSIGLTASAAGSAD